jgi:hypothetical protein
VPATLLAVAGFLFGVYQFGTQPKAAQAARAARPELGAASRSRRRQPLSAEPLDAKDTS